MIRLKAPVAVTLLAVLLLFINLPSYSQSSIPEDILKWENDIALFDSLNAIEIADVGTLLVTGSSSIRMWDSIHADLAPYQVMQRGYGGARLSDYNYYAERIIKPQEFKAILVFVANDIAGGDEDRSPPEMFQLFKDLVKQIRDRNSGTPVCWIETTPTPSRWHVNDQAREANALIKAYCERSNDLHFIATFDFFVTPENLPDSTYFREDMLHMNRDGYLQWAEIIKSSLEEAGIEP
jgi:GDSL-like Lipase/Acylhydrolase family